MTTTTKEAEFFGKAIGEACPLDMSPERLYVETRRFTEALGMSNTESIVASAEASRALRVRREA